MAKSSSGFLFKTGAFALLVAAAYWLFNTFSGKSAPADDQGPLVETPRPALRPSQVPREILPQTGRGELVLHTWYALEYNEDRELADWVAYELTRERLKMPWQERPGSFLPDPLVHTESATPRDYSGSGYDRGHLCPAGDMAFDSLAIGESFYMSNIAPQLPQFNTGMWKELESQTRYWAKKYGKLYVVTGPLWQQPPLESIGFSKVQVPAAYYKVLLSADLEHGIGFILPQNAESSPLSSFACSIDAVEEAAGIDFFPQLLRNADAAMVEAGVDKGAWPFR